MKEPIREKIIMVPLTSVSRFRWDEKCGERLEALRGRTSRENFAALVAENLELPEGRLSGRLKADSCSARYIQKLEKAEMVSIPIEMATAIAIVLEMEVEELLNISSSCFEIR
jgi:hypothetical protein